MAKNKKNIKKQEGFLEKVMSDPIYKWVAYLIFALIFGLVVYILYSIFSSPAVIDYFINFDPSQLNGLKQIFTVEYLMTLEGFNNLISLVIIIIMIFFTIKDHRSFKRNEHVDYKSPITSIGVLGTFLGVFLGLYNFDTTDIDASVPLLLAGLKTAFITSIFGMFLVILLSILQATADYEESDERAWLEKIANKLNFLENSYKFQINVDENLKKLNNMFEEKIEAISENSRSSSYSLNTMNKNMERNLMQLRDLQKSINELGNSIKYANPNTNQNNKINETQGDFFNGI